MHSFKPFLFLFFTFFLKAIAKNYSVEPITTSSGLYYERIGEVLLSNGKWQFVTSVDYEAYLLFYEYLIKRADEVLDFCQALNKSECNDRYNLIQTRLDKIKATDESMANFLGISNKTGRVKRFWSAIGSFLKKIGSGLARLVFGGNKSNIDLSAYNLAINNLQSGQQALQNELFHQRTLFMIYSEKKEFKIDRLKENQDDIQNKISSLENTYDKDRTENDNQIKDLKQMLAEAQNNIKRQEEILKGQSTKVTEIEKNLLLVDESLKVVKDRIEENANIVTAFSKLIRVFEYFKFLLEQFETEQKTLYEVIKNANRGHLDPYILTPLNLINMLQDIQPHLPEGTKLPYYPNIENAKRLYNIIKPSIYLFDYKIIFILEINLVHSKTFDLHKITSLPQTVGENRFVFILPQEPFLVVDKNYQEYMLMSNGNFKEFCEELDGNKYICQQIQEISQSHSSEECEVNLFKSPKRTPESCNKRIMALDKPVFLQLQQARSWIYVVPETENIIVTCTNDRETILLKGTGFIHVNADCTVRTHSFVLPSFDVFTKPVLSNYSPPLNLTNFIDVTAFKNTEVKAKKGILNISPFDFKKLEEISYSIKDNEVDLSALYYTIPIIIVVVLIIFAYLVYKKKIDLSKLRNCSVNARNKSPSTLPPQDNSNSIQTQYKANDHIDLEDVDIYGRPSDKDPESEYLTVKFKVKKQPLASHGKPVSRNLNLHKNNLLALPPKLSEEEEYLNKLRKLKPTK